LNFKNVFNFLKEKEEKLSEKEQTAFVVRKLEEDLVKILDFSLKAKYIFH